MKFVASKRLTEANIRELDQKVQMEAYLREKKEAILEDRKQNELKIMASNEVEDDQKSCLQQVQERY